MKRILKMTAAALLIVLASSTMNVISAQNDYYGNDYDNYDQPGDVSYQTFYDELSPYGNWIEYPGYGYVWQPSMAQDFRPYSTNGHWVWSDQYEWVWVSDYDWGWAPFHYGRWFQDPGYGWLWVPGYEWSGAWVTWRDGGDYYGWAPIRPGINININIGNYQPPVDYWIFAPRRYIFDRYVYNHCVDYRRNVTIINQTTIINNYNYGDRYGFRSGPRRYDFERYTGRVNPIVFRSSDRPGRSLYKENQLSMYRPSVRQSQENRFQPRQFERFDRNNTNQIGDRTFRTGNDQRVRENGEGGFRRNPGTDINTRTNDLPNRNPDYSPRDRQINNDINNTGTGNRRFERTPRTAPSQENRPFRQDRTINNEGNNSVNGNGSTGNENRRFERRQLDSPAPQVRQPQVRDDNSSVYRQQPQMQQQAPQTQRQFERRENGNNNRVSQRVENGNAEPNGNSRGSGRRRF